MESCPLDEIDGELESSKKLFECKIRIVMFNSKMYKNYEVYKMERDTMMTMLEDIAEITEKCIHEVSEIEKMLPQICKGKLVSIWKKKIYVCEQLLDVIMNSLIDFDKGVLRLENESKEIQNKLCKLRDSLFTHNMTSNKSYEYEVVFLEAKKIFHEANQYLCVTEQMGNHIKITVDFMKSRKVDVHKMAMVIKEFLKPFNIIKNK